MTGLGELVRLAARRSRWFYLAWVLALTVVVPATAAAYEQIIDPDNADLLITTMTANPTMRAMLGPPVDLTTAGGFTVWRVGTFVAAMTAIMAVLGIIRSTRAQEEDGRTELLRSGAVGRHAPLAAGMLVTVGACLALGVLVAGAMTALGEPVAGSVAFGAGLALVGATFAGVGAVAAQLSASARTARAIGMWTIAAAYTLRAVADGSSDEAVSRLAWGSPLQWMALVRPYAGERWWVLLLPAAAGLLLLAGAVALEARRDHGSGLWAARRGRAAAPAGLRSGAALAWRLHRGQVVGWSLGMLLFALAMGSLSTSFADMLEQVPQLRVVFERMGGGAEQLAEAFFVAMLGIVSVVMAVVAVQLFGRLPEQEERGHAELVLSTALPRGRLLASHLVIAAAAPVLLLAAVGAVLALNQARATGDASWVAQTAGGALALAPGGLVALGVAVLLHGWAPRRAWLAWVVVGWSLFMVWVGTALGLPEWLTRLTPWAALPQLPVEEMDWAAVLGTLAAAVALMALGAVGYRRRDITGT
ncbi:ABC transporter permease [Serinicoccus marinus]|uniref:ABC transporter permease n=1 Tax=Serinicoccus marinus TaxID=247333 RepID=UPI0024900FA9|nr:hypothetical protein [Serinicoccus marinus]